MIAPLLQSKLEPIARSYRQLHLWRQLRTCWLIAALLGLLLIVVTWFGGGWLPKAPHILLGGTLLASIIIWARCRNLTPDFHWIVREIEAKDPKLGTLLLAAIEQHPDPETNSFNFLQQRVIDEAVEHNRRQPWNQHVDEHLFFAQCGHFAAFCLCLTVLMGMFTLRVEQVSGKGRTLLAGLEVTPGDTTVERGSGLVILAKFNGNAPTDATLVIIPSTGDNQRISLVKNLSDPVFGGGIPEVKGDLLYRIEYAGKQTREYKVKTFDFPKLERADANLKYPDFTGLAERKVEDTRRVTAVEGTELEYTFHLNKPVQYAKLVGDKETAIIPLTPDPARSNVYTAKLTLTKTQRYELRLADAEGRANRLPPSINIEVQQNQAPQMKLAFPRGDQRVSPLEEITFQAEVSDDFGLQAYGIAWSLNGAEPQMIELGKGGKPAEKQKLEYLLSLESLKAQPDQLVSYFVWAEDRGPDGAVRRTFSDMFFAEVRPFDEIFRQGQSPSGESQEQQQQQRNSEEGKLTEIQKQLISATWKVKRQERTAKPSEKFQESAAVLHESQNLALEKARALKEKSEDPRTQGLVEQAEKHMEKALESLAKAKDENSLAPLTAAVGEEQAAYQALLRLNPREHQVVRSRSQSSSSASNSRQQRQLNELDFKEEENRYETQRQATQQNQNPEQKEQLEVLNKLKELAQRQQDVNERLKELQTALNEAKTEQERDELQRQLKRLREEQQQMLADVDELRQRMSRPENQEKMAETREQLDKTREDMRRTAEELDKGGAQQALASGSRAQEDLKKMRDELRKQTSSQFSEEMRQMRQDARELARKEENIAKQLEQMDQTKRKSLGDSGERKELADQLQTQRQSVTNLLNNMRQVTEKAETAEPLLSRQLYETLRTTDPSKMDTALNYATEMLNRNFLKESQDFESRARQEIDQLANRVERAAESVLGNEADALRQAREELDELTRQLERELAQANPNASAPGQRGGNDTNQVAQAGSKAGQQQGQKQGESGQQTQTGQKGQGKQPGEGDQKGEMAQAGGKQGQKSGDQKGEGQKGEGQKGEGNQPGQNGKQGQKGEGQGQQAQNQQGQKGQGKQPGQQPGQGGQGGQQQAGQDNQRDASRNNQAGNRSGNFFDNVSDQRGDGGGGNNARPLTGNEYTQWSDRLRDVADMLENPALRNDVERVRDRARAVRAEFKRHSKQPEWDMVRIQLLEPLNEVRNRVADEIARRDSKDSLVPVDRDPVPPKFADKVKKYYEKLGTGEQAAAPVPGPAPKQP